MKKALSFFLALTLFFAAVPASAESNVKLTAEKADDWTKLFDIRTVTEKATWLGADGIYSIPLDGNDAFGSATEETKTFFPFSDTITGIATGNGRVRSFKMVNHTGILLDGNVPVRSELSFYFGMGNNHDASQNLLTDGRYWLLDGFAKEDELYLFGFLAGSDLKPQDVKLFKVPLKDGEPDFSAFVETREPVDLPSLYAVNTNYMYTFGAGILRNTAAAGAISPDGYVYFYGYRDALNEYSRKDIVCARIKESDLDDFSKVTYWNGKSWGNDVFSSAPLIQAASCEFSVTPVPFGPYKGKYIAIYTKDTQSQYMMYALADTPVGPFAEPVCFYEAPEHGSRGTSGTGKRYTYNAKAHPALSSGTKLLVSYNVNNRCSNISEGLWTIDYHPRFLWLDLDPFGTTKTVTSDRYTVADGFIEVSEGTSAADAMKHLTCSDASSALSFSAAGTLGTDATLFVKQSGITLATYTVFLRGDLTGDAQILADDLTALARHGSCIEPFPVGCARERAADFDRDGFCGAADLTALARRVGGIS